MNNELPIVVMPSRVFWGLFALGAAVGFAAIVYYVNAGPDFTDDDAWLKRLLYALAAFCAFESLLGVWNCFFAPPRMIIDEVGVGGRFIGGGFAGAARVAFGDIIGARYVRKYSHLQRQEYLFIVLDVDNTGGKSVRWWSPYAWWEKYLLSGDNCTFAFNVSRAKLREGQADEIVAVINNRAKGKPPAPPDAGKVGESGKSPFAAD